MAGGQRVPRIGGRILRYSDFVSSGTGLDTKRWTNGGGDTSKVQDLNGNRLRLQNSGAIYTCSYIWATQGIWPTDIGCLQLIEMGGTNGCTASGTLRAQTTTVTAGWECAERSYFWDIIGNGGGLYLQRHDSGSTYATLANTTYTATVGSKHWVRFECVGNRIRLKAWAYGAPEPGAWSLTATDSTYPRAGKAHLGITTGNSTATEAVYWHSVVYYQPTLNEAPPNPMLLFGTTAFTQAMSVTSSGSLTIARQTNKIASVITTATSSVVRAVNKTLSRTSSGAASRRLQAGKVLSVVSSGGSVLQSLKNILQTLSVTSTASGSFLRAVGKVFSPSSSQSPSAQKQVGHAVAVATTGTPQTLKQVATALSATSIATGTAAALRVFVRTLSVASTSTATSLVSVGKRISTAVTSSGGMSRVLSFLRTLSASSTTAPTVTRGIAKGLSATSSAAITSVRAVAKTISATTTAVLDFAATLEAALNHTYAQALSVVSTATPSFAKTIHKAISYAARRAQVFIFDD